MGGKQILRCLLEKWCLMSLRCATTTDIKLIHKPIINLASLKNLLENGLCSLKNAYICTKLIARRQKPRVVTQTAAQTMGKKRRKQCS